MAGHLDFLGPGTLLPSALFHY